MNLLVFGLGYSAGFFARRHAALFDAIAGTTRQGAEAAAAGAPIRILAFDGARATAPVDAALAAADALLVSIPPNAEGDVVLPIFGAAIAASSRLRRIVYLSTIGVYGDARGAWVDEATPPRPTSERTAARVRAEEGWLALGRAHGKGVHILRLAGIYGPGQNALENLRRGQARRIVKPGQVFNRIHVEDISRAVAAAFSRGESAVWNVADNEPAPPQDVIAYAAGLLGVAPPPLVDFAQAEMSPMARSFYSDNKRVSNRRLVEDLGVTLAYPTYREGLRALADELISQEPLA